VTALKEISWATTGVLDRSADAADADARQRLAMMPAYSRLLGHLPGAACNRRRPRGPSPCARRVLPACLRPLGYHGARVAGRSDARVQP